MGELIKNNDFIGISKAFDTAALDELLVQALKDGSRKSKWMKKTSFAPSGIGYGNGTCPRYWFYAFHGARFDYDDTSAPSISNMNAGTDAGKRIAEVLERAGILVDSEVPVDHEDPPIGGFIDAIVMWQDEEIVGEIKTTKTESWQYRAATMKPPGYQLLQLLIYMKVKEKDKGFFLIEDKNTHEILILPIKMTPENKELIEYVFDWMRKVKANSDANMLPERPFTQKSKECKSCPVKVTCWAGYVKELKTRKGEDPNPGRVFLPPLEVPK